MAGEAFVIWETKETRFFSRVDGALRQWIAVTIENPLDQSVTAEVVVEAGGERAVTPLDLIPGVREYRCYAPALWPEHSPVKEAPLRLKVGGWTATATCTVGHYRPWTVYLLSDLCTDYTWVYDHAADVHMDDAAVTEAELTLAERSAEAPEPNRNHYNMVHAREIEFFLERYPEQAERLFEHIRRGTIVVSPFFNMVLTGDLSLEELIRQLYPMRRWAKAHGLEIAYANLQETPTAAWIVPTVLVNSGVRYLVKSILPYECPWAERLEEPPVFIWEGPDGSRVLVRWRNGDYIEGNFVLRDLRATNTALHDHILPHYEALGEVYPFDAIALVGCYGDLAPNSRELPARKAATIEAYNRQGWDYPRLVNASHQQFWDDLEGQLRRRGFSLPVHRGDYGTSWEAWPASLAYDFAAWRRAQERAATADRLMALLSWLDGKVYAAQRSKLEHGWQNLIYLADHAWNGANDANRALNAALRRTWQQEANRAFDEIIHGGLVALGKRIPISDGPHVAVFNGLAWPRSGVVKLTGEAMADRVAVDVETGAVMPTQYVQTATGERMLYFEAREVPSIGYRVFALQPDANMAPREATVVAEGYRLESPFYRLEVSPETGGIVRLYDKIRGRELVDAHSPYHLNQCLYLSEGVEHTPRRATIRPGPCGAVFGQLVVHAALKNTYLVSTITLYGGLDCVEICNEVTKLPTSEKQELDFVFPFAVPGRQYRYEAPGVIVEPGVDQRPGAGQAVTAVRHFVDVFNAEFGVLLSQADTGLIEFGHRTTQEDPLAPDLTNSTLFVLAMENCIDWHEAVRDQGGATQFTFRYRICGHEGGFDAVRAVRFGAEDNNELLPLVLAGAQPGVLPAGRCSFLRVEPAHVIVTCFKPAEEEGLIVRLWECEGRDTEARLIVSGLGRLRAAWRTDLLERNLAELSVSENTVAVPVQGRGLATVRLLFS